MALTRAIAATGETVTNTELTVTSALTVDVAVTLPIINDGSNGTVADNSSILFSANSTGKITVKDNYGHTVCTVKSGENWEVNAQSNTSGLVWRAYKVPDVNFLLGAAVLAPGAGSALVLNAASNAAVTTPATVYKYLKFIDPSGVPCFIPCWK